MNRIYKLIWSKTRNCYVVVSELAKQHTKSSSGIGSAVVRGVLAGAVCLSLTAGICSPVWAGNEQGTASGDGAVAIGVASAASGSGGVAVGAQAKANYVDTVAIGAGTVTGVGYSTALGAHSTASGQYSSVFGYQASASGIGAVAIGYGSTATQQNVVSFGNNTTKRRLVNIANGTANNDAVNVSQLNNVYNTLNNSLYSLSSKTNLIASSNYGSAAVYGGNNNTAFGSGSFTSYGDGNTAIGQDSIASGAESIAFGHGSHAGENSTHSGGNNIAIGASSRTSATFNNVAIGNSSYAGGGSGFNNINEWRNALSGNVFSYYGSVEKAGEELQRLTSNERLNETEARAEMEFQVWLNDPAFVSSQWTGDYNSALGSGARATTRGDTAIGGSAWATGGHSTAVGVGARASGLVSTALGQSTRAETPGAIAIGDRASVLDTEWSHHIPDEHGGNDWDLPATNAIAIGSEARALSRDTTTVGRYSQALMPTSTAYGNNSHANGQVSIAIGNKATAGYEADIFNLTPERDASGNPVIDNDGKYVYKIDSVKDPMAGDSSIAMGNRATSVQRNDVAIGTSSYTDGRDSVTVGVQARATGKNSIAIGGGEAMYQILDARNLPEVGNPHTEGARYYGVATTNQAAGDYSISAGYNNKTVGEASSAVGKENSVTGTGSLAAGSGNRIGTVQYVDLTSTVILPDGTDTGVNLVPDGYEGGAEQYLKDAAEGKITGLVLDQKDQENNVTGYAIGTDNEIMSFKAAAETDGQAGTGDGAGTTDDGTGSDAGEQAGGEGNNEQTGTRSYAGAYGHKNIVHGENGYATGNENKINQGADNALAIGIGNVLGVEPAEEEESGDGDGNGTMGDGGDNNTAASTAGKNSIAMGNNNTVIGEDSMAIGIGHIVKGKGSGAIGDPNKVNGDSSYILGNNSEIGSINSGDAAEDQEETTGEIVVDNAFIIGNDSKIVNENAKGGLIFGSDAEVSEENGLALGNNTNVTLADSVALGSYAQAAVIGGYEKPAEDDVKVGDLTYSSSRFAGTGDEVIGTVSVGGEKVRTVTNVAAGLIAADSTDAINGSQLYAVYDQLPWKVGIDKDGGTNKDGALEQSVVWKQDEKNDKSNVTFYAGPGVDISYKPLDKEDGYGVKISSKFESATTENGKITTITYDGDTYEMGGGDKILTDNRAVGLKPNDKEEQEIISPFIHINGVKDATEKGHESGLYAYANGENGIAIGSKADSSADKSIALGYNAQANDDATDAIAIGSNAVARNEQAIAIGKDAEAKGEGAVAIGGESESTGKSSVAMQNGRASGDYATAFGIKTEAGGKASTAFGKNSTASADNSLAALGGTVVEGATNSAAIGEGATAQLEDTVALGSGSVANTEKGAVGYDILLDGASEETNSTWKATHNAIAVGDGDKVTRQITGVAAGTEDTDAVNVAQLKRVLDAMNNVEQEASAHSTVTVDGSEVDKDVTDGNLLLKVNKEDGKGTNYDLKLNNQLDLGDDGSITMGDTKIDGDSITANTVNGDTVNADTVNTKTIQLGDEGNSTNITYDGDRINYGDKVVATTDDGLDFAGDDGEVISKKLTEQLDVVGGAADKASEYNIYTYKDGEQLRINLAKEIKGVDKISVGDNTTITGDEITTKTVNADTFKAGDTTVNGDGLTIKDGPKVTKDGIDAGGNKITNVAKGTEDDDAVNYSQLKDAMNQSGDTYNYLNNKVDRMDKKINKVGAGAAALAGLHPLDFDPDEKWHVAAGVGSYYNETAVALGAFYQPTDDVLFNVATTLGDGRNMVSGGVSIRFGQKSHQSRSKKAMAKEIIELREEVAELKALVYDLTGKGGLDPSKTAVFPDTPENHWAYDYVAVLAGNGVLEGYQDGYFKGNRQLTRYEMAAIIYRLMSKGIEVDNRMLQEFAPELARVKVDTLTHYGDGTPHIQRVRIIPQRG